jgi:radical S-adenosyl methionine domain-containing protein 2
MSGARITSDGGKRSAATLPPTVNLHLVAHCNYACRYCYARFEAERRVPRTQVDSWIRLLRILPEHGVRRVTFAGGEPTLLPELRELLQTASEAGIVTSIVTNAARIDQAWLDVHAPWLRWLAVSIDSVDRANAAALGRSPKGQADVDHPAHVRRVFDLVNAFNATRPPERRLRTKVNITVTQANLDEDPTEFLRACRPEKVKLLQMQLVAGENDDAADLACSSDAFQAYVARVLPLRAEDIDVVVEDNEAMDGSYAMVDPVGRFYQRVDGRYVRSEPILDVGVMEAWRCVGGYDSDRFVARGGDYDPGALADGNRPYWVAVEGLDGSGKSTTVARLAARLGAVVVTNPPQSMRADRAAADALPDEARRRWYLSANVEAARQARAHQDAGRAVVMDRSLASTLAFGAAERAEVAEGADWPPELPRPDYLLLLNVSEPERRRRLFGRDGELTAEERRLLVDHAFRERVLCGYRRLGALGVPADGDPAEILASIERLLRRTPSS